MTESPDPSTLTGTRIRERRLARGMAQGALAKAIGISPSYLNLIEHNHRRIGGKLLISLARVLRVDVAVLAEGTQAGLDELMQAARRGGTAETDRIDELAARFPGWTGTLAAQEQRVQALEAQIEALRDRLSHDTGLSEAMHEVLSSVAAIRSTADILARERDLDATWLQRFHRNLHEEAERLSERATGLIGEFELPDGRGGDAMRLAVEAAEAMFDLADHHFPEIEADGEAGIDAVLARSVGFETEEARELARTWLSAYAADAARLPLQTFGPAAAQADHDPERLLGWAGGDVALVLRRLAALPPEPGRAPFGLAIVDATGALLFRRRVPGFSIPRAGAGCPRWPLYRVGARPGQAEASVVEVGGRVQFRTWAIAEPMAELGFGRAPVLRATMLVRAVPPGEVVDGALEVGPDCPTCSAMRHVPRG